MQTSLNDPKDRKALAKARALARLAAQEQAFLAGERHSQGVLPYEGGCDSMSGLEEDEVPF